MGTEQFSLCWDNFHSNMSSGLNALLKSEDLVDVTLAAEGRYIKAHKMVLSVCSPYFRELFSVNPCKHPIVFLKDVSYNALSSLLEFMYQGEVKVSQDDLGMFIKTAEALKIKGLTGDGSNATENDEESEKATNSSTPVPEQQAPVPAKRPNMSTEKPQQMRKKMLGPASKRFKATDSPKERAFTPEELQTQATPVEANVQFKMEPEETILDQEDTFDDVHGNDATNNSMEYLMEDTKMDVKAGPSSTLEMNDVAAENQERLIFVQGSKKGIPQLIIRNYLYIKHCGQLSQTSYWKCHMYDRGDCKARCTITNRVISFKGKHSHAPDLARIRNRFIIFEGMFQTHSVLSPNCFL